MFRVRGLELLYNLQKKNFKSKEDCLVVAIHNLFINENLLCAGTGEEWPASNLRTSELLPKDWNDNQDVYSLRYISKDTQSRFLMKATKMDHILQVDVAMNENAVASTNIPVDNYVADDYDNDYSTAYINLESFVGSFQENIIQCLRCRSQTGSSSSSKKKPPTPKTPQPQVPPRPRASLEMEEEPRRPRFPQLGESDRNPTGSGQGGMLVDPSNMGIPSRPTLPQLGVGTPGGLPRGAVPPGARFDPITPPTIPSGPNPDHLKPPDNPDSA